MPDFVMHNSFGNEMDNVCTAVNPLQEEFIVQQQRNVILYIPHLEIPDGPSLIS